MLWSSCPALTLLAAPPLTTVQDVLYKADGTPFNGLATISWQSFEAADSSNIAAQSLECGSDEWVFACAAGADDQCEYADDLLGSI